MKSIGTTLPPTALCVFSTQIRRVLGKCTSSMRILALASWRSNVPSGLLASVLGLTPANWSDTHTHTKTKLTPRTMLSSPSSQIQHENTNVCNKLESVRQNIVKGRADHMRWLCMLIKANFHFRSQAVMPSVVMIKGPHLICCTTVTRLFWISQKRSEKCFAIIISIILPKNFTEVESCCF